MRTCALQSGSNGNAIYVEANGVRLLVDAGISGRQAKLRLAQHGRDIRRVDALLLTHAHADHTRAAGVYQRMYQIPIYASRETLKAIRPHVGQLRDVQTFEVGDVLDFGAVQVHTVPTPHDADGSCAAVIAQGARRLGIFTDLGHPFDGLSAHLRSLDALYLESNYDPDMLRDGPYPVWLQERIRGLSGHISNDESATLLHTCGWQRLRWAALAHLSEHNNHPELAMQVHRRLLGDQAPLHMTSRYGASDLFEL